MEEDGAEVDTSINLNPEKVMNKKTFFSCFHSAEKTYTFWPKNKFS